VYHVQVPEIIFRYHCVFAKNVNKVSRLTPITRTGKILAPSGQNHHTISFIRTIIVNLDHTKAACASSRSEASTC
jgi:hypothetical protein